MKKEINDIKQYKEDYEFLDDFLKEDDMKLDDRMFEVAFAKVENKKEMLKLLVQVSTHQIKDIPGFTYYQTDNLELEFIDPPKVSWCLDGEEYKTPMTKFSFRVDTSMKMLLPRENINRLFKEE